MRTSRLGVLFIAQREALVLRAYRDGIHHSIGFGSNDPALKPGDEITVAEAFRRLKTDIATRELVVDRMLKVPVKQHEWDALVSLYYQGGSDGLRAVCKLLNAGKHQEAADEFLKWGTNAKGEPMAGLLRRREREREMFLRASYGDDLMTLPMWRGNPRTTPREEYHVQEEDLVDVPA